MRRQSAQGLRLALTQLGRRFQDGVARAIVTERSEQVGSQCAGAGAEFQDVRHALRQYLAQLPGQRRTEQSADSRRGDEIAGGAELGRPPRVVAQARLVKRQRHVVVKGDPAASRLDGVTDALRKSLARGGCVGVRSGKFHDEARQE